MDDLTVDNGTVTPQAEEKTFSQAELDRIIGERLSRERSKHEEIQAGLEKREQALAKREFTLQATEILKQKGLPIEIMEALDGSSIEAFDKAARAIEKHMRVVKNSPPAGGMISPMTPSRGDPIRKAMGLK